MFIKTRSLFTGTSYRSECIQLVTCHVSRECPRPRDGGQRDDQRQAPAEPRLPRPVTPVLLPTRAVLHVDVVRAGPVDAVPRQQIFLRFIANIFQSIYPFTKYSKDFM